ncbi:uncharacterized protein LOC114715075 [Neltuma alba]|uniref:uncharacterized protein LOC114715075 n=1 Tax=Neltuma alba TaxID=207710 RepID=UPI0010A54597|nr:uncharacterized protein LOC114715075 [Prosopis alba]
MLRDLEELRIEYCGIGVIVAKDQVSESVTPLLKFPRLTFLELSSLENLRNFYPQKHTLEWPHLYRLSIRSCDELEIFEKEVSSSLEIHEEGSSLDSKYPLLSQCKVLLPKLEILRLSNLIGLIPLIWEDQLSHNSFRNLKTLFVESCGFVKLVPLRVLKSLNNLEELEVRECDTLELVFDFEDLNDYKEAESSSVIVPLKKLTLCGLQKLKNVWSNHYKGDVSFPSLRSVHVSYCESLTSLFPASIAKGMLRDLEELRIEYCGMDVIVAKDQLSESVAPLLEFPKLTFLKLSSLKNLRSFYPQTHTLEWPHLYRLSIRSCDKLEIFEKEVSSSLEIHEEGSSLDSKYPLLSHGKVTYNLEKLTLMGKGAEVIGSGQLSMYCFPKVKVLYLHVGYDESKSISYKLLKSFPNLEELRLRGHIKEALGGGDDAHLPIKLSLDEIYNITSLVPLLVSPPNLTHLHMVSCYELTTLMTSSVARSLVHLTSLSISNCDGIEEIIWKEEGEDDDDEEFVFSKLQHLKVERMPKIRSILSWTH